MEAMDCKQADLLLIDYLYGELDPAQAEAFERHLASCASHAREVASSRQVLELSRSGREEVPEGLEERILHIARAAVPERPRAGFLFGMRLGPAAAAAVLAVVVVTAGLAIHHMTASVEEQTHEAPATAPVTVSTAAKEEARTQRGAQQDTRARLAKSAPEAPETEEIQAEKAATEQPADAAAGPAGQDLDDTPVGGLRGDTPESADSTGFAPAPRRDPAKHRRARRRGKHKARKAPVRKAPVTSEKKKEARTGSVAAITAKDKASWGEAKQPAPGLDAGADGAGRAAGAGGVRGGAVRQYKSDDSARLRSFAQPPPPPMAPEPALDTATAAGEPAPRAQLPQAEAEGAKADRAPVEDMLAGSGPDDREAKAAGRADAAEPREADDIESEEDALPGTMSRERKLQEAQDEQLYRKPKGRREVAKKTKMQPAAAATRGATVLDFFAAAERDLADKRYDQAVSNYRTFLRQRPGDPRATAARYRIGKALFLAGRCRAAVAAFNDALRAAPGHALATEARFDQASCLVRLGQLERARQVYRQILQSASPAEAKEAQRSLERIEGR